MLQGVLSMRHLFCELRLLNQISNYYFFYFDDEFTTLNSELKH